MLKVPQIYYSGDVSMGLRKTATDIGKGRALEMEGADVLWMWFDDYFAVQMISEL